MIIAAAVLVSFFVFSLFLIIFGQSQAMIELRSLIHDTIIYTKIIDFFQPSPGFHGEKKPKNINIEANTRFYPQPPGDFVDPFMSSETLYKDSKFYASKSKFIKKPFEQPTRTRGKKERRIHAKLNPPLISFSNTHEYTAPGIPQEPDEPKAETKEKQNPATPSTPSTPSKTENNGEKKIERTTTQAVNQTPQKENNLAGKGGQ